MMGGEGTGGVGEDVVGAGDWVGYEVGVFSPIVSICIYST